MKLFFKSCLKSVGVHNTIQWYVEHTYRWINEDHFFSIFISTLSKRGVFAPNMPTPEEAARFSFEQSPSYLFNLCNARLPFGCHGFLKHGYNEFWKEFIRDNN